MPQGATFQTSDSRYFKFSCIDFNLDSFENLSKTFKTTLTDFWLFGKNVLSSAYAVYKKSSSKIFRPLIFLFELISEF